MFPDTAIAFGALAMTEGDLKYGAYNYRDEGVAASVYHAAARRHIAAYWNGEWADPDTKVPHLGSALGCIAILIDAGECGVLTDDRPPKAGVAATQRWLEGRVKELQQIFLNPPPRHTAITYVTATDVLNRQKGKMKWEGNEIDKSEVERLGYSLVDVPHGVFIRTGSASPSNAGTADSTEK